ncbi:MAG: MBL fold metallo-hydrolase [Alphaproteobacteria bacterium]|uniref:MBL fold metallo-hydrolase n=1 Tax=Aestuariivirga sp. TaxID=2650926 RepID=UPI00301A1B92|nr:MBL fold metallo-hydrolase [Alphaproteobacteria bacterium]
MTQLKAFIIPVTPFQQNCSLVYDEARKVGAIVDPGGDVPVILDAIRQSGVKIEKILLTHGHIDHAGGAAELAEKLNVPIEGPHVEDTFLLEALPESGTKYGMTGVRPVTPDRWLKEGDTVTVGDLEFKIYEAPGHTPGSVVFFNDANRFALVGDVLFQGSVGRTDFPRGDHATLIRSIKEKLYPLGDDVVCLPGHGQPCQIGTERQTNAFLNEPDQT